MMLQRKLTKIICVFTLLLIGSKTSYACQYVIRNTSGVIISGTTVNICSGNSITLIADTTTTPPYCSSFTSYVWSPVSLPNNDTITVSPTSNTLYTVEFINGVTVVGTATVQVNVTPAPVASINYSGTPFCKSLTTPQPVTLTGTTGGTYSSTPAGLTLNASTGAITPSSSTVGIYTVTYTIAASGGCPQVQATTSVTISQASSASINYSGTPFCKSLTTPQPVTLTGTTGGTYSSTPAGLTLNASTGAITPSSSTVGIYTVTYTIAASGGCAQFQTNTPVTISQAPSASINYSGTPFCKSLTTPQPVTLTGTTGGTYSSTPAGLTLNASTGAITPSSSTVGIYTVTYTIAASGGCAQFQTNTPVTISQAPSASINYSGTPFCKSLTTPQPVTLTGTTGGTYSSTPAGLTLNASTGAITPSSSTVGIYTVTYTIAASGGCAQFQTNTPVTISQAPSAIINYSGTPFCKSLTTPQPVTLTGTTGGTYSSTPAGLTLNASTGAITPSSSTVGTYTVTYTIAASGGCPQVQATTSVTVNPSPIITSSTVSQTLCSEQPTTAINFTSSVTGASITWTNNNTGIGLGASSSGNIPSFTAINNGSTAVTATITVHGTASSCQGPDSTVTITVNPSPKISSTPKQQTVCNGQPTTAINFTSSVTGASITWTNNNTGIGLGASSSGNIPSFTAINNGSTAVTATITVHGTASSCQGPDSTVTITVNPSPKISSTPKQQTVCNGQPTTAINFTSSVTGASITWTNNNTGIGLGASSSGNIPSFTAINNGSTAVTATITVHGTASSCQGPDSTLTININPSPLISLTPVSQILCNGQPTTGINFTSNLSGSTTAWTNNNTGIGLSASGSGNIPSFTATNNGSTAVTATITVHGTSTNGCQGPNSTATIIVNPTPAKPQVSNLVEQSFPASICGGTENVNFNISVTDPTLTYTWSINPPSVSSFVEIKNDSTANTVISFANNSSPYSATIIFQSAISATGCSNSDSVKVNVSSQNAPTISPIIEKQPGNLLVYLDNTVESYQWGYDSIFTLEPHNIPGQIYQVFAPDPMSQFISGDSLNTTTYAYWVRISSGSCFTKVYYNGPYATRFEPVEQVPDEITSIIYPNPNDGNFTLRLSGAIYGELDIKIINMLGEVVSQIQDTKTDPRQEYPLQILNINKGVYFIYVNATGGDRTVTKLIITK